MTTTEENIDIVQILNVLLNEEELIVKPFHTGNIILLIKNNFYVCLKDKQMKSERLNVEKLYRESINLYLIIKLVNYK